MSILILNKRPLGSTPYDQWFQDANRDVIVITALNHTTPEEAAALRQRYARIETFESYDNNGNVERLARQIHAETPITRIVALSEQDVLRAARLREQLGLPGQSVRSATHYRDKLRMKQAAQYGNVKTPKFAGVSNPTDLLNFIKLNGLPVVIKPRLGYGSMSVRFVRTEADLELALDQLFQGFADQDPGLMVETFVDGEMYHIDGVVLNNQMVFARPSQYLNSCVSFRDNVPLGSVTLEPSHRLYGRLIQMAADVIEALPDGDSFAFHLEVFHTPEDGLVFCEIASRAGGAGVVPTLNETFQVNINQLAARGQAGLNASVPRNRVEKAGSWMLFPPRNGVLVSAPSEAPFSFVRQSSITAVPGRNYQDAVNSVDKIAMFITTGETEQAVRQNTRQLIHWFHQECRWENVR